VFSILQLLINRFSQVCPRTGRHWYMIHEIKYGLPLYIGSLTTVWSSDA